ncbi:calcium-binding protein [Amaricoccus solimangrovi]|nr:calcium-binding protein [Amaricoccus solimangrovi]
MARKLISGTDAAELLTGGTADERIEALGGNDTVLGGDGDDYLLGGDGNDLLVGNRGDDIMKGEAGRDRMVWNNGDGSDLMNGGTGYDTAEVNGADTDGDEFVVEGAAGHVRFERVNLGPFALDIRETEKLVVKGLGGDDEIDASGLEAGAIRLRAYGGDGDDELTGGSGDDYLSGGDGDDHLAGEVGDDVMKGGDGDDVMEWDNGDGSDVMNGGRGYDTAEVEGAETAGDIFEVRDSGDGVQFERTNLGNFTLDIEKTELLRVNGLGGDDTIDASELSAGRIELKAYGGDGDDELTGGSGDDYLSGGDGDDHLEGEVGDDVMKGGDGDDVMEWDNGDGSDVMNGGRGHDTAEVEGAETAGDIFEIRDSGDGVQFERTNLGNFTLDIEKTEVLRVNGLGGDDTIDASELSAGAIRLKAYGSDGDDALIGGEGRDYLDGGAGDDEMTGGAGADTFVFRSGSDTITDFQPGEDVVRLRVSGAWDDWGSIENAASQQGDDVVLDFGHGNVLTLEDTQLAHLSQDDFLF